VICDIVKERVEVAEKALSAYGKVRAVAGDVTDKAFIERLVCQAQEHFGSLDVVVNNAGIALFEPFLEHTEASWDKTIDVNLKATFLLGQRAAQAMVAQGQGGAVVNMASTNGHVGEGGLVAYNASKAGVILLTKTMAVELAPHGIRVNCVAPGFILTELAGEAGVDQEFIKEYVKKIPLNRYGKPEEVANLFAFLASDEASFITGESIVIDGGQLAQE